MKLSARLENVRKVIHAINLVCGVDGKELEESGVDLVGHQICNKQCKTKRADPVKGSIMVHVLGVEERSCSGCILLDINKKQVDKLFDDIIKEIKVHELLE